MEYWDHWCSIWLKNNTVDGINKPWIEKTSTEDLEYLNYLNIALGSCGEFHYQHSNIPSFHVGGIKLVSLKAA